MVSGSFSYSDTADETLTQFAQRHPEAAMAEIGKLMLDEQQAWTLFAAKFHIFTKLPEEIVTAWLRVQVEAARTIARHLPAPTLDGTGNLFLPPLTEFVPRSGFTRRNEGESLQLASQMGSECYRDSQVPRRDTVGSTRLRGAGAPAIGA